MIRDAELWPPHHKCTLWHEFHKQHSIDTIAVAKYHKSQCMMKTLQLLKIEGMLGMYVIQALHFLRTITNFALAQYPQVATPRIVFYVDVYEVHNYRQLTIHCHEDELLIHFQQPQFAN